MPRSQTNVHTCTRFQHNSSTLRHPRQVWALWDKPRRPRSTPAHKPCIRLQAPILLKTTTQNQTRDHRYAQNSVVRQRRDATVQAVTLHSGEIHVCGRCAVAFGLSVTCKDRELAPPTCRMPRLRAYTITKALTSSNLALPPGVTLTG